MGVFYIKKSLLLFFSKFLNAFHRSYLFFLEGGEVLCWVLILCVGFLQLQQAGATLHCGVQASRFGGFSR